MWPLLSYFAIPPDQPVSCGFHVHVALEIQSVKPDAVESLRSPGASRIDHCYHRTRAGHVGRARYGFPNDRRGQALRSLDAVGLVRLRGETYAHVAAGPFNRRHLEIVVKDGAAALTVGDCGVGRAAEVDEEGFVGLDESVGDDFDGHGLAGRTGWDGG